MYQGWHPSELIAKFYSREPISLDLPASDTGSSNRDVLWYYCREEEQSEMIGYNNVNWPIQWFHAACLHIAKIPKGKWYCPANAVGMEKR